jgi:hypothetical protein
MCHYRLLMSHPQRGYPLLQPQERRSTLRLPLRYALLVCYHPLGNGRGVRLLRHLHSPLLLELLQAEPLNVSCLPIYHLATASGEVFCMGSSCKQALSIRAFGLFGLLQDHWRILGKGAGRQQNGIVLVYGGSHAPVVIMDIA